MNPRGAAAMPISWNEIATTPSVSPVKGGCKTQKAEKQTFWNDFAVFGIPRRTFASFEEPVRRISGEFGYIDLFWPGVMLVEHKSRGTKIWARPNHRRFAISETFCKRGGKTRFLVMSSSPTSRIALHDLCPKSENRFRCSTDSRWRASSFLSRNCTTIFTVLHLSPAISSTSSRTKIQSTFAPVQIMDDLHDTLAAGGYEGHDLERFLVRVLFCLFAEDTGILTRCFPALHRRSDKTGWKRPGTAVGTAFRGSRYTF